MAEVGTCLSTNDYLAAAESIQADLTVVGPEAPLVAGIVDEFQSRGLPDPRSYGGRRATGR